MGYGVPWDLAEALAREVNAQSFAPPWVLARAILEVVALITDVAIRLETAVKEATIEAFKTFDDHLYATMLGFKSMEWAFSEDVVVKNLLTAVDRVDRRFNGFRSMYDLLSEGAHPNYIGMIEAYQRPHQEAYIDRPAAKMPDRIKIALSSSWDEKAGLLNGMHLRSR